MKHARGLTLIELMVVLSVIGILFSFAVPNFQTMLLENKSTSNINKVNQLIRYARNIAVTHQTNTTLCPSFDGLECSSNWNDGILLFIDHNANSKLDKDDEIVRSVQPFIDSGSLVFRSLRNKVQFNDRGLPRGTVGSFVYCANEDSKLGKAMIISFQGRIRNGRDSNGDGIVETGSYKNIVC